MRRRFARQLNNIFAQIRLNRFDADLIPAHGSDAAPRSPSIWISRPFCLRFAPRYRSADLHSLCCRLCKMHMNAVRSRVFRKQIQIIVQMRDRMQPNLPAAFPPIVPVPCSFGAVQLAVAKPLRRELNRIAQENHCSAPDSARSLTVAHLASFDPLMRPSPLHIAAPPDA